MNSWLIIVLLFGRFGMRGGCGCRPCTGGKDSKGCRGPEPREGHREERREKCKEAHRPECREGRRDECEVRHEKECPLTAGRDLTPPPGWADYPCKKTDCDQ